MAQLRAEVPLSAADLRMEISKLLKDVNVAKTLLVPTTAPSAIESAHCVPITPVPALPSKHTKSLRSFRSSKMPKAKIILANMASPFRLFRGRSQKNHTYARLDEEQALLDSRRGSADSEATLVDSSEGVELSKPQDVTVRNDTDVAGDFLKVLGPIVASLQKLSPGVVANEDLALVDDFTMVCEKTLEVLVALSTIHMPKTEQNEHEIDMSSLMLGALRKKVESERDTVRQIHQADGPLESSLNDDSHSMGSCKNHISGVPALNPPSQNPFVIHSTSITLSTSKRSSVAGKGVPICAHGSKTEDIQGQQTWARNVIRLGSFQNSMLFSPSPIAVRQAATVHPHHQPLQVQVD